MYLYSHYAKYYIRMLDDCLLRSYYLVSIQTFSKVLSTSRLINTDRADILELQLDIA
jgi:hypothetical protein